MAKTRIPRNLALGDGKHGEGKRERLLARKKAAAEAAEDGELDDLFEEDVESQSQSLEEWAEEGGRDDRSGGKRGKKGNIPSWKKHADKKRVRQAAKRMTAKQAVGEI